MADTFRRIAEKIRAEYTLGFYPPRGADGAARPGGHSLRVEVIDQPTLRVTHRAAYYVPATP
jgi:hypothetical protein